MDRLKQIETFVAVAQKGSLTAAAQAEGVAPAVIGRRMDALEERLGVKLLLRTSQDLGRHQCLTLSSEASQTRGWAFSVDGMVSHLRPGGRLDCSDGQVLHEWCLRGLGIAWRSTWEVQADLAAGRLVSVLDDFAAPPNGIYAVVPSARHLPLRVRLWMDYLKHSYQATGYWG
ncbi:MAG: hypothetical protein C4K60_14870 [Ideonella sp. MAG2]|nr:MAG: hypothetical protein C4K60_14870 [Ideonella sp. MAG2]